MDNSQIMILSSDALAGQEMEIYFRESRYGVLLYTDYQEVLSLLHERKLHPDIILYNMGMPSREEYEAIRNIKDYSDIRILILSEDDRLDSQLYAYSMKIDDYMVKPCPLPLVEAHVEAIFRRGNEKSASRKSVGKLMVDFDQGRAYLAGSPMSLTAMEYDLLAYLVNHRGMVLSRDKILDSVWGYDYVGGYRSVDTVIKNLRAKLGKEAPYIRTIYGVGYCLDI